MSPRLPQYTLLCERCQATNYCSKACQIEDWPWHKRFICDPFCELIEKASADGIAYLGPCQESMPANNSMTITFHMFQKRDGSKIRMRLFLSLK
jgi:hypothetical protein